MKIFGFNLDTLWWGICRGLMQIIDWLGQAFNFLIGADMTDANGNGGTGGNISNLFVEIFKGSEGGVSVTQLYFWIMAGCILFLGILAAIGAIKAQFTKGATDSLAQMGEKTLFSLIKMVSIPIVFFVALGAMGYIFNWLIEVMSNGSAGSDSIAQKLCEACTENNKFILFNESYDEGKISGNFNFLLCILSSCCLVVTLVTVSINLVKRIIEVFFYYLTAPVALARTPIDDGKSFDLWKENVVSKLLSAGGIIICMYLYYMITPIFIAQVESWQDLGANREVVANVIKILFIIGGSFVPANASMMLAQLISQGAGQNESNNLMHTQQMLGNAGQLAGRALLGGAGAAAAAVFGKGKGGAGSTASALGGAASAFTGAKGGGAATMASAAGGAAPALGGAANAAGSAAKKPGYFGQVGNAVKNSWQAAGRAMKSPSPMQGMTGKLAGAAVAAGTLIGGVLSAPFKPLLKKGASAAGKAAKATGKGAMAAGGKMGRAAKHAVFAARGGEAGAVKRANNKTNKANLKAENKAAKAGAKASRRELKQDIKADTNLSTLRGNLAVDSANATSANTQSFIDNKTDSLEKKFNSVESFLDKNKKAQNWSEEQKQEYREARYGKEAAEYMSYKPQLQNSGVDMNRYNDMFSKLQGGLPKQKDEPKEGNNANGNGGNA